MSEFAFELRLCAHLEARRDGVVSRQLGASLAGGGANRVMDVLLVEPGPEFGERVALTPDRIPVAAIESDVGVGKARSLRSLDGHPEYVHRYVDRAVEAGFFERERRDAQTVVRQVARYPDWFSRLVGVENKPDLSTPGDLETQLRKDVSLGLLDEIILATESYVTRAHLHRIPPEVGVWRVDWDREDPVEVVREPTPLSPDEPGVDIVEEATGRTDVRMVDPAAKARKRRKLAERAYGKGWRTYGMPACTNATAGEAAGTTGLPFCRWKGRLVDAAAECTADCPGHDPAEPPAVGRDDERERRTPWVADPGRKTRRQAGLDRFS
ncbi:DUF5787 family protein [Halobacteriaceae archaeon GCM10025711]